MLVQCTVYYTYTTFVLPLTYPYLDHLPSKFRLQVNMYEYSGSVLYRNLEVE